MRARGGVVRPRCGCDAGRKCRIVDVEVDLTSWQVRLELLTQVEPDYLTEGYH